ncbi:MAG: DUF1232 domain-containing protein [Myxococcales bacterium]|nr:DUF1232 domain-containing protein [Myxococcales bacterium]
MKRLKMVGYVVGIGLSALYLFNPGSGVFELLPDNLPGIGNLDEAAMTAFLIACFRGLKQLRSANADAPLLDGSKSAET